MNRKKICFVVPALGTARVFLKNHLIALSNHFDVYLVANVVEDELIFFSDVAIKEIKNIKLVRNIALISDLQSLFYLYRYFKLMKFDSVQTITPKVGLLGILASRLAGVSIRIHIFTGQVWHTKKGLYKRFLMFLDRFIVWNSTCILVDGHSQREFLIQNKIVISSNAAVLGKGSTSGVDTSRFSPDFVAKRKVREELGIKENEVVYMFLGRMNAEKGINELTQAFSLLRKKYINVRLLLVGDDEGNMKELIKQIDFDINAVLFFDVTSTPEYYIQACDVFCLPSYREGFPMSVLEAASMEKPILCSDTYGLSGSIIENKTGIKHKVADVDSLYVAMEQLFHNPNLVQSYGKEGRKYVVENFSSTLMTKKWLEFYLNQFSLDEI